VAFGRKVPPAPRSQILLGSTICRTKVTPLPVCSQKTLAFRIAVCFETSHRATYSTLQLYVRGSNDFRNVTRSLREQLLMKLFLDVVDLKEYALCQLHGVKFWLFVWYEVFRCSKKMRTTAICIEYASSKMKQKRKKLDDAAYVL
jgi:hypothetical protein